MQLIRQHADAGAGSEIVGSIGFERNVAEMIRQHHERLDGSGYPAGLRDETGPRWGRPSDTRAGFSSSETEPASAARLSLPSVQLLSGGSTTAMISTCSVIGNRSNAFSERSTQPTSRRTRRSRANEAGSHAT